MRFNEVRQSLRFPSDVKTEITLTPCDVTVFLTALQFATRVTEPKNYSYQSRPKSSLVVSYNKPALRLIDYDVIAAQK